MWWVPIAASVAGSVAQSMMNKGNKGGEATVVPPVLDINDAPERVYQEQYGQRTPYEPFIPYMLGTGGAGRQFGVPQYTPEYRNYLTTLGNGSQGLNTSQMLGGARLGGPPRMFAGGGIYPQVQNSGGVQDYYNPYTMPSPMPPVLRPSMPQIANDNRNDPTPWRLKSHDELGMLPEIWDERSKTWRSAYNIRPEALASDRYTRVG